MFKKQSAVRTKAAKRRRSLDPRKQMMLLQVGVGIAIFGIIGIILTGIWYGTRVQSLTLSTITVSGGETISSTVVQEKAIAPLSGNYIGLIPRRFAWLYPYDDIKAAVQSVERIKDPMIRRVSGTELVITFNEYKSFALWCGEQLEGCLLIDDSGYAFARAPRLTGGALMRYYTLGRVPAIGETFVSADNLKTMNSFVAQVGQLTPFAISSVEIDKAEDVFYRISGGGEIKATLTMSAEEVFSNLQAVLSAEEFTNLAPGNFQYIDLRFGSKVFVNDTLPVAATSTATTSENIFSTSTVSAESVTQ